MSKWTVGDRVGVIIGASGKVVKLLGYGTYEGDEVPPKDIGGFNTGLPNPKIKLDNGKIVWGCETYWGSEEGMRQRIAAWAESGYEIKTVDIDEERAAALKGD